MSGDAISALLDWATSHGAEIDENLQFKYSEDRGVYAVSTSSSSSCGLKIPLELIMDGSMAVGVFGCELSTDRIQNGGVKLLLCKLKYDKSPTRYKEVILNDFFSHYIKLLPTGRSTRSPYYWYDDELSLFQNSNLGGSLPAKFRAVVEEWFAIVTNLPESFQDEQYHLDLHFYNKVFSCSRDELIDELLSQDSWTSFGAYLWSTIIFTSRAFPNKIINSEVKDGQAMLLPVIDLLNHDTSARVNWSYETAASRGYFSLQLLGPLEAGKEVFNNYGAKGNEELLMGYGFVIPENPNDSVALRLPVNLKQLALAQKLHIHLPTIDDYTYHAFDTAMTPVSTTDLESFIQEGLLYFINRSQLVPDPLLDFFTAMTLNELEHQFTIRSRLQALQALRNAIDSKLALLKKKPKATVSSANDIVICSKIYISGQKELLKSCSAEIKSQEKKLLQDWKSQIWNIKKIYKKHSPFREALAQLGFNTVEEAEASHEYQAYLSLWVLLLVKIPSEEFQPPQWIIDCFHKLDEDLQTFRTDAIHATMVRELKEGLGDLPIAEHINEEDMLLAEKVVDLNSYTRSNGYETILVGPMTI